MNNLIKSIAIITLFFSVVTLKAQQDEKPLKEFQFSFLPMVSTDGTQTLNYRYQLSFNLIAGITGGVHGLELGGFANITNGRVEGLQLAGFGNIVNGRMQGMQGAGFINIVNGFSKGVNGAGFINIVRSGSEGVMGAGFMNVVAGDNKTVSGAGFMNLTRGNLYGLTGAGFMNINGANMQGLTGSGFMNISGGDVQGLQGAGFGNVSGGKMQGAQLAGFMNVARDVEGLQAAGFLNVAGEVKGFQLGFINVSDTIDGVPVGFLSIVKRGGLRQIELATSDVMYLNASFKIGVPLFYNIFSMGYRPFHDQVYSATGYGVGTEMQLTETSRMHFEVHTSSIHRDWDWWKDGDYNNLNELRAIYSLQPLQHLQLFAGVTLYNHHFRTSEEYDAESLSLAPYMIYECQRGSRHSQWWVGARAGVRVVLR